MEYTIILKVTPKFGQDMYVMRQDILFHLKDLRDYDIHFAEYAEPGIQFDAKEK